MGSPAGAGPAEESVAPPVGEAAAAKTVGEAAAAVTVDWEAGLAVGERAQVEMAVAAMVAAVAAEAGPQVWREGPPGEATLEAGAMKAAAEMATALVEASTAAPEELVAAAVAMGVLEVATRVAAVAVMVEAGTVAVGWAAVAEAVADGWGLQEGALEGLVMVVEARAVAS